MKMVQVPSTFHEVLGKESTITEMLLIFVTSVGITVPLFAMTYAEWSGMSVWKYILLFLLVFDILAGFVANLTYGTNQFYHGSLKARLVFIALHVQPLLFAYLWGKYWEISLVIWGYTVIAALVVNGLYRYPAQRAVAGGFVAIGLAGLLLKGSELPQILLIASVFYLLKVVFSFAVDHYARRGER